MDDPLKTQVDGSHYKNYGIQPVEYYHANKLDWFQGESIKYITRWKHKNGLTDLKKAIHILQLYIELETVEKSEDKHEQ